MSQESLFDAADYVQKAYDQLVLAHRAHETAEIASLKWQMLQTWLSLQEARMLAQATDETLTLEMQTDDAPF